MKVPFEWLKDFVPIEVGPDEVSRRLTMRGLEVEAEERVEPAFSDVVVGEIVDMDRHPGADKLSLCKVDVGRDVISLVCGAQNIAVGNKVPTAVPGARLADGTAIEKRKIKGVESVGMLCSERELGLSDDHSGIFILPDDLKTGDLLQDALSLVDCVLDVNVPPNRGDCQSILGIAREVASILNQTVRLPGLDPEDAGDRQLEMGLRVLDKEACPRYVLRLIDGISIVPSPFWMRNRIGKCGMRPINSIVDVTNYIMLELGQPLHAFDYSRLTERRIEVRPAAAGLLFRTLDGTDRKLEKGDILICDGQGPVALAGIMGGENSEITSLTRTVALESAFFNPISIRRTARRLDIRSEASLRFEKGIDKENVDYAAKRAVLLMKQISGGTVVPGSKEFHDKGEPKSIPVSLKRVNELIGVPIEREKVVKALNSIDIRVKKKDKDELLFEVPSFRHDLDEYMDIVEEVARLVGFENIPATVPVSGLLPVSPTSTDCAIEVVKRYLTGAGFFEVINYAFFDVKDIERFLIPESDERARYVGILNPISKELGVMRTFLSAGMLEDLAYNINRGTKNLRLFEVGKVFFRNEQLPREANLVGCCVTGKDRDYFWRDSFAEVDFFDIKGILEGLLERFDLSLTVRSSEAPFLQKPEAADLFLGETRIGWLGRIRDDVLATYGIEQKVYCSEVNLDAIAEKGADKRTYRPVSRYPNVVRDFSFYVNADTPVAGLIEKIKGVSPLIVSVGVFDMFKKEERRSVSFRVAFQSFEETLRDETVNDLQGIIIQELSKIEGLKLRT